MFVVKIKKPPFEINKKIMTEAIEIAELVGIVCAGSGIA